MNFELNELIDNADIVRFIKSQRIRWLGHIHRMEHNRTTKRITEWKPVESRGRGRPRKRCLQDMEEDLKSMGIRNWRRIAVDRMRWCLIVEEAKTHIGL